jgi:hypothetical protein
MQVKPRPAWVLPFLLMPLLLSCSATVPPPAPVDAESSAIGMALKIREGPLRLTAKTPEVVLFVRLEESEDLENLKSKDELIPSNYVRDEYAYLLNVEAGRYLAVAAVYGEDVEPFASPELSTGTSANLGGGFGAGVGVSYTLDIGGGEDIYRNYFSKELIAQTLTIVQPGSFAFMGRFVTDQSMSFGDGDEVQIHFLSVLEGPAAQRSSLVKNIFSSEKQHQLTPHESQRDKESMVKFCKKAKEHLKGTPWAQMVDRMLKNQ